MMLHLILMCIPIYKYNRLLIQVPVSLDHQETGSTQRSVKFSDVRETAKEVQAAEEEEEEEEEKDEGDKTEETTEENSQGNN